MNTSISEEELTEIIKPTEEVVATKKADIEQVKSSKPTFGQSILEKVKKFFEEVE